MSDNKDIYNIFKKHTWINRRLNDLRNLIYTEIKDLRVCVFKNAKYPNVVEAESLPFRDIREGSNWGEPGDTAWFHVTSKLPSNIKNKHIVLMINIGAEGIVYRDRKPIASVAPTIEPIDLYNASPSNEEIEIVDSSKGGEIINLYIEATFNGIFDHSLIKRAKFEYAKMCSVNNLYKKFYYDYLSLCCVYVSLTSLSAQYELKDLLDRSYYYAIEGEVENAINLLYSVIKSFNDQTFNISASGFSHIQIGGNYSLDETSKKISRTLIEQSNNLIKYDNYKFATSQPGLIELVKDVDKDLLSIYKKYSEENRFEIEGGFFVEPNIMIISGESLIRQIYYGKETIKKLFNKDTKVAILPNAYSLPISLPQILKKCDIDYLLTASLSKYGFDFNSVMMRGNDGTRILLHDLCDNEVCGDGSPIASDYIKKHLHDNNATKMALMLYGTTYGVGGPNEIHIEMVNREKSLCFTPTVTPSSINSFYKKLFNYNYILPLIENEIAVNYNQPSYTVQSFIKASNRRCEKILKQIEYLDACYFLKTGKSNETEIDDFWKRVLLLQSNKILSGYSISDVNDEVLRRYSDLLKEMHELKDNYIAKLLGKGDKYFTFNPSSCDQHGRMPNGSPYSLKPYEIKEREPMKYPHFYAYDNNSISNGVITIKFNRFGQIVSVSDGSKEYIRKRSNILRLYSERFGNSDYKEMDKKYIRKRGVVLKAHKSTLSFHRNKITKTFYYNQNDIKITQIISLYDGKAGAEIKTIINENNTNKMLRVEFNPSYWNNECVCKSQFCEVKRPTKVLTNDPHHEMCCQGYLYVYNKKKGAGFCILSDKKYGYGIHDKTISLNLLKSNKYQNANNRDLKQDFKYTILPMDETNKDSIFETYSSMAYPIEIYTGKKPLESLIMSSNPKAVITSIKKAHNKDAIVCRIYENCGKSLDTKLKINFEYKNVIETNLIERPLGDNNINIEEIHLNPYEIKTFLINLK